MRRAGAPLGRAIIGALALIAGGCQLVSGLGDLRVVEPAGDAGTSACMPGATRACYSGAEATRGKGTCHDGLETCNAEGDGFGACEGEALPGTEENCAGAIDLDCDGAPPVCHGDATWSRGFGGPADDQGPAIAVGKGASPIFAGTFKGSFDFGGAPIASAGGTDIVSWRGDSSGKAMGVRRFGGSDDDVANGIAGDDGNNVILAGRYRGAIDFGDGMELSNAGDPDAFVTLFDATDKAVWSLGLGDGSAQEALAVTADVALDVIAVGTMAGTITTPVGTVASLGTADVDAFVIKISPTGAPLWIRKFADALGGEQRALAVATDKAKAVIVAGTGKGDLDFGGGPQPGGGGYDAFVAKLDLDGALAWSRSFGDAANAQSADAVAVAANSDVLIAGGFDGAMTFEQPLIAEGPGRDVFVARLDASGKPLWSRRFGDAADQAAYAVAVDAYDNVYVGGSFDGTIDLGASKLVSAGGGDAFVIKLDPTGAPLWGRRAGDAAFQSVRGIVVDPSGASTVVGSFAGTLDFTEPFKSAGGTDIFVAHFSP